MDIIKCSRCGMQVVAKGYGTCPSCQANLAGGGDEPETVVAEPVTQPVSYPQSNVSHLRGVGFGCLYAFLTWLLVGFVAIPVIPLFVGNLTHQGVGSVAGSIAIALAIPLGIYGFLRHQYFQETD